MKTEKAQKSQKYCLSVRGPVAGKARLFALGCSWGRTPLAIKAVRRGGNPAALEVKVLCPKIQKRLSKMGEAERGPRSHLEGRPGRTAEGAGEAGGRHWVTGLFSSFPALEKVTGGSLRRPRPSSRPSLLPSSRRPATTQRKPGAATSTSSCATRTAPAPCTHFMCSPPCLRYGARGRGTARRRQASFRWREGRWSPAGLVLFAAPGTPGLRLTPAFLITIICSAVAS